MRTLYLDCSCGAAGDMLVGALIDAGADFARIRQGLESLGVSGYTLSAEKVKKHNIVGTKFNVHLSDEHQPHRHLSHVLEIMDRGDLPEPVKEASRVTFRRIAECEAEIHGTTVEKIHFHEVGAIDSIVDVLGAHLALHTLGVKRIAASPLNVGGGTVPCAHGILPVPTPATALLLIGAPAYGTDGQGELVTPTGAALVTQLASNYGPMPPMRVESVGYGCGTRDLPDRANALRVLLGESYDAASPGETINVIETNIDDMNPELFPPLLADLMRKGARDAYIAPVLGKKGRPAHQVTVLCDERNLSVMLSVLFEGSTTLGVRMRTEQRVCLERTWKTVRTRWGEVRIKVGTYQGRQTVSAPEFEDCRKLAEAADVPVLCVYEAALAAAIKGETLDA
ncbi:MAG: nickel pincer cofactor biosynthesis protein LarC [Candidatus Hydrogenedentes bacterium]|nr:nickel pincer cofactor biosynthesis protein LarC [Candidatus Hydrogenedentota bacterium]